MNGIVEPLEELRRQTQLSAVDDRVFHAFDVLRSNLSVLFVRLTDVD